MEYEMNSNTAKPIELMFQQSCDLNNNVGRVTQNQNLAAAAGSTNVASTWPKKNKITDFFQVSRVPFKQQKLEPKDFLYIPAENATFQDLMKADGRKTVTVNDKELALIAHNNAVYAIEPKCPHIGGPIHTGDIEEIPGCGPCIKCPWHSWKFSLTTGQCISPQNRNTGKKLQIFPVRLSPSGNDIKIGFTEISPKTFNLVPE